MFFGIRDWRFERWCQQNTWRGKPPKLEVTTQVLRWDRTFIDMGTLLDWPHIGVAIEVISQDSNDISIDQIKLVGKHHNTPRSIRNFVKSKWNQSQGFEELVDRQWWRVANLTAGMDDPRLYHSSLELLNREGVRVPQGMTMENVCRDQIIELNISFPSGYQRYEGTFVHGDVPDGYFVPRYRPLRKLEKGERVIGSVLRSEPLETRQDREEIVLGDDEDSREIQDILAARKVLLTGLCSEKWFISEYDHVRLPGTLTGNQRKIKRLDRARE